MWSERGDGNIRMGSGSGGKGKGKGRVAYGDTPPMITLSDGMLVTTRAVVDEMSEISPTSIHPRVGNSKVKSLSSDNLWRNLTGSMPIPLLIGVPSQSLHPSSLRRISSPEFNILNAVNAFDGRRLCLQLPSEGEKSKKRERERGILLSKSDNFVPFRTPLSNQVQGIGNSMTHQ